MLFPLTNKITSLNPPALLLDVLIISNAHLLFSVIEKPGALKLQTLLHVKSSIVFIDFSTSFLKSSFLNKAKIKKVRNQILNLTLPLRV